MSSHMYNQPFGYIVDTW